VRPPIPASNFYWRGVAAGVAIARTELAYTAFVRKWGKSCPGAVASLEEGARSC
jgi:hypothetical protein